MRILIPIRSLEAVMRTAIYALKNETWLAQCRSKAFGECFNSLSVRGSEQIYKTRSLISTSGSLRVLILHHSYYSVNVLPTQRSNAAKFQQSTGLRVYRCCRICCIEGWRKRCIGQSSATANEYRVIHAPWNH